MAKYLIDVNLPYYFALWNTSEYIHQMDINPLAKDKLIWEYAKERVVNNLPAWAVSFFTMLRCFVGHLALAKLPSRALPGKKIASPNSGNLFTPHS